MIHVIISDSIFTRMYRNAAIFGLFLYNLKLIYMCIYMGIQCFCYQSCTYSISIGASPPPFLEKTILFLNFASILLLLLCLISFS